MIFVIRNEFDFECEFNVGDRVYACAYKMDDAGHRLRDIPPVLVEITATGDAHCVNVLGYAVPVKEDGTLEQDEIRMMPGLHFTDNLYEAWALYRGDVREAQVSVSKQIIGLKQEEQNLADKVSRCTQMMQSLEPQSELGQRNDKGRGAE